MFDLPNLTIPYSQLFSGLTSQGTADGATDPKKLFGGIGPSSISAGIDLVGQIGGNMLQKKYGEDGIIMDHEAKKMAALQYGSKGASIGTSIMPGIGTAVGAAAGALGGLLFGKGNEDEVLKERRSSNREAMRLESQNSYQMGKSNIPKYGYNAPGLYARGGFTTGGGGGKKGKKSPDTTAPLTAADRANINNSVASMDMSDALMNRLFERVVPGAGPEQLPVNLGRYGDVGYFDVMQNTPNELLLTNTAANPHNAQTLNNLLPYLMQQNPGRNVRFQYTPMRANGGFAPVDYKVEKGEVMHVPPGSLATDGAGSADQIGQNMVKFKGDSHNAKSGGIGVIGGNKPFVDFNGNLQPSGFVFSNRLKTDPKKFLKNI